MTSCAGWGIRSTNDYTSLIYLAPQNVTITPEGLNEVSESQSYEIKCRVKSRPVSNITWYKDSVQITDGGAHNISETETAGDVSAIESVLSIGSVDDKDSGVYKCVVAYPHSVSDKSSILIVRCKYQQKKCLLFYLICIER